MCWRADSRGVEKIEEEKDGTTIPALAWRTGLKFHSAHWYLFLVFSNFLSFRRQEQYDCLYKTEKPTGEEKNTAQTAWRKDGFQEMEAAKSLERSRTFSNNYDRLLCVSCLPNYRFQSRYNTQSVKILLARETRRRAFLQSGHLPMSF